MTAKRSLLKPRKSPVLTIILWMLLAYFMLPLLWLLVNASKTNAELFATFGLSLAPTFALWDNIGQLFTFQDGIYVRWFANTILYAVVGAGGAAFAGAGFGLGASATGSGAGVLGCSGASPGLPRMRRFFTSTTTVFDRPWLKLCFTLPVSTVRLIPSGARAPSFGLSVWSLILFLQLLQPSRSPRRGRRHPGRHRGQ